MRNIMAEERNQNIIRGLMKLPHNRRCINCNSVGPEYVCTNFWTFVCITCAGIHREFTHGVKSASMQNFTSQELEALQRGGNQRARELFLKYWDPQQQRLPASSNVDSVREFIKNAYVDRRYAGGKNSDMTPRDVQVSRGSDEPQEKSPVEGANGSPSSMKMVLGELERKKMQQYSSGELARITENFTSQVGSGAYGDVFKGKFPNGVQVAVKKLRDNAVNVMEHTFMAEVGTMSRTLHRHLVRLFGYCFEVNMKALVYEYLENGSLDKVLYENHLNLQWKSLYEIAIGTAIGLSYLHEGCDEEIIHYDVKPGNVLLNSKLSPKVADFGVAKIYQRDSSHISAIEFRGTRSFAAPEMCMDMPMAPTPKSDTYSFGMMLFEVLGRRRNSDGQDWLPGIVWEKFKKGHLDEVMEYYGIKDEDKLKAEILCKTALWCTQHRPENRPTMSDVVQVLKEKIQLPSPPDPQYVCSVSSSTSIWGGSSTKISGPSYSRLD